MDQRKLEYRPRSVVWLSEVSSRSVRSVAGRRSQVVIEGPSRLAKRVKIVAFSLCAPSQSPKSSAQIPEPSACSSPTSRVTQHREHLIRNYAGPSDLVRKKMEGGKGAGVDQPKLRLSPPNYPRFCRRVAPGNPAEWKQITGRGKARKPKGAESSRVSS